MEKERLLSLIQKAQSEDAQALNDLFTETYNDVYYFALKTVKDETLAADITQDTFVSIFQNISTLGDPVAYPAWSRQITYRICLQYLKKQAREVTVDENEDGSTLFDTIEEDRTEFIPEAGLDKEDFKKTILEIVDRLPEEQRAAIVLYYYDELSIKEIAQIQGVTEGTVKSRLNYGRKAIKTSVEDYEKKNNIKLHCAGVLPLLLWLFASDASACTMSAAAVETVTAGVSAATGTTLSLVKTGTKAVWALWQKIVAGLVGAAVAVGGTVAVVNIVNKPAEPQVQVWQGQGAITAGCNFSLSDENHFLLEVEEMDETYIKGKLTVTPVKGAAYQRNFDGEGSIKTDGTIMYRVQLDAPVEQLTLGDNGYSDLILYYTPALDHFAFYILPYEAVLIK